MRTNWPILGVHIMAPHASEMIFQASLAMAMEATVEELVQAVYLHLTVASRYWRRRWRSCARLSIFSE